MCLVYVYCEHVYVFDLSVNEEKPVQFGRICLCFFVLFFKIDNNMSNFVTFSIFWMRFRICEKCLDEYVIYIKVMNVQKLQQEFNVC